MRKKSLLMVLSVVLVSMFSLFACTDKTNSKVKFTQNEIVVSQNEPINFFDYLDLGDFQQTNINFTFSRNDLVKEEMNEYKACDIGGQTTVFANKNGKVLAETKLIVKYKFAPPEKIEISEDGYLTWENSYVYNGSEIKYASQYIVKINGEELPMPVIGNTFFIGEEQGEYLVQIKAKGIEEEYIDASEFSVEKEVCYRVVPKVENVEYLPSQSFGNSEGTITWGAANYFGQDARYNVYLGDIKILNDSEERKVSVDLNNFKAGQSTEIVIEAFIPNSDILSSRRLIPVTKLTNPRVKYQGGLLSWDEDLNAEQYRVFYVDKRDPSINGIINEGNNGSILNGLSHGIYEVQVQAVGMINGNGIFASSGVSNTIDCVKLENPEIAYSVEGSRVIINFTQDEYIKNYTIRYADQVVNFNTTAGLTKIIDMSGLEAGKYEFNIFATPTLSGGEILPWQSAEGESYSNVVNADVKVFTIYKHPAFESVTHSLDEYNNSILTFEAIDYADIYKVTINGEELLFEDVEPVYLENEGKYIVNLNLGDLSSKIVEKYNIVVEAFRKDENSISVSFQKEINLLPVVTAEGTENQENGLFKWQSASEYAKYVYEIYKLDGLYKLGSEELNNAISGITPLVGETENTVINNQINDFGYYYIRIYTRTRNQEVTDRFLDGDFNDENRYYQSIFTVQARLGTPKLTFGLNDETGTYAVTIPNVEFSDKYLISVLYNDETIEDTLFNSPAADRVYFFGTNQFDRAGNYTISVVANSGEEIPKDMEGEFIKILHPNSEISVVNVEKLANPTFTSEDIDQDLILTLKGPSHVGDIIISKNGERLNNEGDNTLDLSQISGEIVFQFIATDEDETDNNYYLDSNPTPYTFVRAARPTNLVHRKGNLIFECADEEYIDEYKVEITLVNTLNPNYTIVASAEKGKEFGLQDYIQNEVKINSRFKSEYEQWSKQKNGVIEIKVFAYKLSYVEVDGKTVFMMPSLAATTPTGEEKLSLVNLDAPEIIGYDTENRILSWQPVGSAIGVTTYDVFVGDERVETNTTGTTYNFNLKNIQFGTAKEITVVAYNDSYLSFASSKPITIKRLNSIQKVNVMQSGEVYFTLPLTGVERVECNGQTVNLNTNTGRVSFNLSDYESDGTANISLGVIAKNEGSDIYYENSLLSNFAFENISNKLIEYTNKGGVLSWTNVTPDFAGVEGNPVTYTITIHRDSPKLITGISENKYPLNSSDLYDLSIGNYSLDVTVVIPDYLIGGKNCKGYYGSLTSAQFSVEKLEVVSEEEISLSLKENDTLRISQRKVNADVIISWPNKWQGEVAFDITINDKSIKSLKEGDLSSDYSLTLSENKYLLTLKQSSYFVAGENNFEIQVNADDAISSNKTTKTINKFATVTKATIDENGLLTIEGEKGDYAISIIYNDKTVDKEISDNSVDIMDLLQLSQGRYTFEVVRFDSKNISLPSVGVYGSSGYRLQGIGSAEIKDTGNVEISLFNESEIDENIVFVAKRNDEVKEFEPQRKEESAIFNYSLMDFIKLFHIENEGKVIIQISVRKTGCVNADWKDVEYNYLARESGVTYTRGRNYNDDYIKITKVEDTTTAITFTLLLAGQTEQNAINRTYLASELEGFWITTEEGGYFTKEKPSNVSPEKIESCYGLSLNSLLREVEKGEVTIIISRIAHSDQGYTQYNSVEISQINKLSKVESVVLRDGVLTWRNSTESDVTGYYVYFYVQDGDALKQSFYKSTTTAFLDIKALTEVQAGTNYYLRVVAVSSKEKFIASNEANQVNAMKYRSPSKVQIQNGRIVFDEQAVLNSDFLTAIKTNYNTTNFVSTMATTTFTNLFHFSASSIRSARIRLQFKDGNRVYYATVNAYDLMPDLSQYTFKSSTTDPIDYLFAIEKEIDGISGSSEFKTNLQAMLDILKNVNGIARNGLLFDDFGRSIPSGNYTITLCQTGLDNIGTITSDYSQECKASVTEAPTIVFSTESQNNKTQYLITFKRVNIRHGLEENAVKANRYVFYLENAYDGKITTFIIENTAGDSGVEYFLKASVKISIPLVYNEADDTLTLNITEHLAALRIAKTTYNFTIYAEGNGYAINGKTDMKTLSLLDINPKNITLEDGELSWTVEDRYNASSTKVVLKQKNVAAITTQIEFVGTKAMLELANVGEYEYIILSLLGGYSNSSMSVDSDSYMIRNLYKLSDISVSASDDHFTIEDPNTLGGYYSIYNDVDGIGNPCTQAGKEYSPTQFKASEYFFRKLGSSGDFTEETLTEIDIEQGADHILAINGVSPIILSSNITSLKVAFLNSIESFNIENGDLSWSINKKNITLPEGHEIVYEVTACIKGDAITRKQTLYTAATTLDTLLFTELPDLSNDQKYVFEVRALAYKLTEDNGDIQTVEGKNYLKTQITIDDKVLLAGKEYTYSGGEGGITRAATPTGISTKYGRLSWDETGGLRYGFRTSVTQEVSLENLKYGDNPHKLFIYSYQKGVADKIKSKLQPVTFNGDSRIYKLPQVEKDDFVLLPREGFVEIDLSNLYTRKTISGTDAYYRVKLTVIVDESEYVAYSYKDANQNFSLYFKEEEFGAKDNVITVPSTYKSLGLKFQVVDNQGTTQRIMTLNGEETPYDITPLMWGKGDTVTWNNEKMQFEWTYTTDSADKIVPMYRVKVSYLVVDGLVKTVKTEEAEVFTNYYQPRRLGNITKIEVWVRKDANSIYSTEPIRYDPTKEEIYGQNGIVYNIFAGGDGSKENPYRIANSEQFKNIKYRNNQEIKYYFQQTADIDFSIKGFGLNEAFYGEYNGYFNGVKTLNLTLSPSAVATENGGSLSLGFKFATSARQNVDVTFGGFGGLFKEIAAGGVVKNLSLSLNFNGAPLKQNALMTGLALINYGKIENINIISVTSSYTISSGSSNNTLAQAGLVGRNFGNITGCANNAEVNVRLNSPYANNVIVSGLVLANEKDQSIKGIISDSYNNGNITVTNTKKNSMIWISGLVINNTSEILRSGNNGNLETINGTKDAYSSYIAGVSFKNENATLSYCYNNGAIALGISSTTNFTGGIAYVMKSGRVSGLVDTSKSKIINTCLETIRQGDMTYASNGNLSITSSSPSEIEFDCGDGKTMKIVLVGEEYKASII